MNGPSAAASLRGAAAPTTGAAAPQVLSATPVLLPKPTQPIGGIEGLYALMAEAGASEQKNGKAEVERKFVEKHEALQRFVKELQKSIEDKADGGGPFKTLAIVAMAVVAAAATVMTLGAAAPLVVGVGLALSASGFLVTETKCLDPILGDGVSQWVGMGLGIAGAVVTMGAGAGASAGSALETVAKGAQGVSAVAQGCQTASDAIQNYNADGHAEKAVAAQQQMRRIQVAIDDIIQRLGEAKDDSRRGAEAVNQMLVTADETLALAAGGRA